MMVVDKEVDMKNFYPIKTKTNTVLVRDEARYHVVDRAIKKLSELLSRGAYCSMSVRPNEESETSMTVEFVTDSINTSSEDFSTSISLAERIAIAPRSDGFLSVFLLFDGLYTPAVRIC